MSKPLRVVIVDDCPIYRKILRTVLESSADVEVVGVAANGQLALESIEVVKPDLVTLDVEMPELDGLGVLRNLKRQRSDVGVIMVSGHTLAGAKLTTEALELGAFDFVLKPEGDSPATSRSKLKSDLLPKLKEFADSRLRRNNAAKECRVPQGNGAYEVTSGSRAPEVIVMGASTGGPAAFNEILGAMPHDFPVPLVIAQPMPSVFTRALSESLNSNSALKVQEAENGMPLATGHVYVCPGEKKTVISRASSWKTFVVSEQTKRGRTVDELFESAAEVYGDRAIGAVLTGSGKDGLEGCRALKERKALVLALDEPSCVVYEMSRHVIDAGLADAVLPLQRFADALQMEGDRALLTQG